VRLATAPKPELILHQWVQAFQDTEVLGVDCWVWEWDCCSFTAVEIVAARLVLQQKPSQQPCFIMVWCFVVDCPQQDLIECN
jgi:hypothetical protein